MIIVKNSPGISFSMDTRIARRELLGTFSGSARTRRKNRKKKVKKIGIQNKDVKKENRLSSRSKMKIRLKIYALAGILPKLTFVTLTFVNKVEDRKAVEILKCFLENAMKRYPNLAYLWVGEKQTKNKSFPNNIHFHLITNIRWDIKRWWRYWIELQEKFGVVPREGQRAGSSAFDVKTIKSSNKKAIGNYIAGYLSKSSDTFDCRVWHCSRKVSQLYTGFYSGIEFIDELRRLEQRGLLGGNIRAKSKEFCTILLIPINPTTERFYEKIHVKNRELWFGKH